MATNPKGKMTKEIKALSQTREERRRAQRAELIKQGLARRERTMRRGSE